MSMYELGLLLSFLLILALLACSAVFIPNFRCAEKPVSGELSDQAELAFNILRSNSSTPEETAKGFDLAMEAAREGIPLGMKTVTASYFFGRGVPQSYTRARQWAQRVAELGDSSGKWIYIEAFMKDPENNCLDPEMAETDMSRYRRLCERTIEQRADEIRAIEYGAEIMKKHRPAELFIASLLWCHPAEGNNESALKILEKHRPESNSKIAVLKYLTGLGSTIATYRIFHDVYPAASACAGKKAGAPEDCDLKLKKADIQGPVCDAVYLPLKSRELQNRILIKGTWDEKWTFFVNGTDVQVDLNFQADGMGGASHSIRKPCRSVIYLTALIGLVEMSAVFSITLF